MKDLIDIAARLQSFCEQRGWQFCFIGGLAVQHLAELAAQKEAPEILDRLEALRARYA